MEERKGKEEDEGVTKVRRSKKRRRKGREEGKGKNEVE